MKLKQMTLIAALALGSLLTIGTTVNAQDTTMTAPAATPPARPARGGRQLTIEQLTTALTLTANGTLGASTAYSVRYWCGGN